jgi:hypothetical protein
VSRPPPSLSIYTLSKRLPGLWSGTDLLNGDGQLLVELRAYADEEGRVANEQAEQQARDTARLERRRSGRSGPGR